MIEKALRGSRSYWLWMLFLLVVAAAGFLSYLRQWDIGLGVTGLSRNISWGLYIANFTFFVGVAASAVMVVLPYYLHDTKAFGKITVLGEFLAVGAVIMSVLFVFVDLGQPSRVLNVLLYPSPSSLLFWDMIVLNGYLVLNLLVGWASLDAEHKAEPPASWVKPLVLLSIPWAISIHTVTAFIYSGLGARPFWLTALLAPRFLSSAFASGPALLIMMALILKKGTKFDAGKEAIQKVAQIVTYGLLVTLFFFLVETFTVFYSALPAHEEHFVYLLFGLAGKSDLVPWMWGSLMLTVLALVLLINPATRRNEPLLFLACIATFVSIWIDKGLGLIVPGFSPSPLGEITLYAPTAPEILITAGVWALGFLVISVLYKLVIEVRTGER